EVGYWLWDAADHAVMRCFMIPRGSTVLAGGTATPDVTEFTLAADVGSEIYGILSNPYLARAARTIRYVCTVNVGPDEWSYDETSTIDHERHGDVLEHTDRNRLHRVAS
ncbi:MAG TPA: FABP family protein, partial [Acidimicrobiia bacterium]|nr:FABP family protein [Acidimicrobiia bacterium]